MSVAEVSSPAEAAYAEFADFYDRYTEHPGYRDWILRLLAHARGHGFARGRVLDVGAGTGQSTLPLLDAGLDVVATEPVATMRALAQRTLGEGREVLPHAAGDLPVLGVFGLALMVNDVANYLLGEAELDDAFRAIAANLAVGGLLLFDVNTLATFRAVFAATSVAEIGDMRFVWRGLGDGAIDSGGLAEATLEAFSAAAGGGAPHAACRHVQRHHPLETVLSALAGAGLEPVDVFGQDAEGVRTAGPPNELAQRKWIYLARKT